LLSSAVEPSGCGKSFRDQVDHASGIGQSVIGIRPASVIVFNPELRSGDQSQAFLPFAVNYYSLF